MKFLEKYDFKKEDIDEFIGNTPKKILESIKEHQELVEENISFIKGLNTKNYREIFINYPDLFLMDASNFTEMLNKYDSESLLEKLDANYKVVEYL